MTAQPKPLRIKQLTLTDFRAFPGPAPSHFDLNGKNLLVYGENGSGKSSIFRALEGFFSFKQSNNLLKHKNVFSGKPEADCRVSIEFVGDTTPVEWSISHHPCMIDLKAPVSNWHQYYFAGSDPRVKDAALRRACLDYRALLDTNYMHGDGAVNLFNIALERLLADYPVAVAGGVQRTVGELWRAVEQAMPTKHTAPKLTRVNQACVAFNSGFNQALNALYPLIGTLLSELIGADVAVAPFVFGGITYTAAYYKRDRKIAGRTLTLDVSYRTHQLATPQHFLNEARLSALALAIYLAGRLACTPTATPDALKLLVLDDVLIGLDHSNRLPVLDVLHTHFADWQVLLLTHDKTWFDLARERLPKNGWTCCEIYEGDSLAAAPMPIVRLTQKKPARALLQKADDLLKLGYVEAAANYTRQAFELGMQGACELKSIKLSYRQDPTSYKAQNFLDALKGWQGSANVPKADWDAAIDRLELLKNVVMNPYSHPSSPNIPKQEVVDANNAVTDFLDLVAKK